MKMKPEHYAHMIEQMRMNAEAIPAHREYLKSDERVKDLEKRLRWDVMYASGLTAYICDELYDYLDDSHIDTALRAIMIELKKEEEDR